MATTVECISQFPALESISGAALTFSLAYLNLERFRYRAKIREHARKELSRFRSANGLDRLLKNKWYRQVERLAALPDNDRLSPKAIEEAARTSGVQTDPKGNGNIHMPDGLWGKIYQIIFSFHADRIACYLFTAVSLLALLMGSAHGIGAWPFAECYGQGIYIEIVFYLLVSGTLGPILFIMLGRRVVLWATDFATESASELEGLMQGNVQAATIRTMPRFPRPPTSPRPNFPGDLTPKGK